MLGVVVPGRPAGVEAHVRLPLPARHVVVLVLLLPAERVPLKSKKRGSGQLGGSGGGSLTGVVALLALPLLLLEAEAVVVAGVPVRVHLHVALPLGARLLVILGLLLARQAVPLRGGKEGLISYLSKFGLCGSIEQRNTIS